MEDLTGKQLGQYRVVGPLGEGGMAAVYKAYDSGLDRYVAVKVLPRHFTSDPEFIGRFEQEAKLIASLQDVHILPVYDFGQEDDYTFIVMAFVQTGTLADQLEDHPLPLPETLRIVGQVGDALAYAHEQGVVHRDVKPSNILIDDRGNCLLTDFGISKIVEATVEFTQTGAIIGTPAYMSPEQILGEELDGRSDLYSLGIMLFEMATGRQPYRAKTPPAIFVKHLHDPLPMPRSLNPDLPEAVELVILRALAKNREDRYASAGALVKALSEAITAAPPLPEELVAAVALTIGDDEIELEPPRAGEPEPEIRTGIQQRGRVLAGIGVLVLIAALAGLGINALSDNEASAELPSTQILPTATVAALPSPSPPDLATLTLGAGDSVEMPPVRSSLTYEEGQSYLPVPGCLYSQLQIGDFARLSQIPPFRNIVRENPARASQELGRIQPGERVRVLAGPICGNGGELWWQVEKLDDGVIGWTLEGDEEFFWLISENA